MSDAKLTLIPAPAPEQRGVVIPLRPAIYNADAMNLRRQIAERFISTEAGGYDPLDAKGEDA